MLSLFCHVLHSVIMWLVFLAILRSPSQERYLVHVPCITIQILACVDSFSVQTLSAGDSLTRFPTRPPRSHYPFLTFRKWILSLYSGTLQTKTLIQKPALQIPNLEQQLATHKIRSFIPIFSCRPLSSNTESPLLKPKRTLQP